MRLGKFLGMFIKDHDQIADIYRDLRKNGLSSFQALVKTNQSSEMSVTARRFQRKIKTRHVNKLARAMVADQFAPGTITIGVVKNEAPTLPDTVISILDGQHRIDAMRASETVQPMIFAVRAFDTEDDMKREALRLDAHSKRNGGDHAAIMEIDLGTSLGTVFNSYVMPAVETIIRLHAIKDLPTNGSREITGDVREACYKFLRNKIIEYFNTAKYGSRFVDPDYPELRKGRLEQLRWASVVGMGVATFYADDTLAEQFWRAISTNNLAPNSPEQALWDFINGRYHIDPKKDKGTGGNQGRRLAMAVKIAWDYKLAKKKLDGARLKTLVYKTLEGDESYSFTVA